MWNELVKRPLVILTLALCSGIIIASRIRINFLPVYLLAILFLCFSFFTIRNGFLFSLSLLCLFFLLGITLWKNNQSLPRCHILRLFYKNHEQYIVKGFIDTEPVIKNNRTSFILKTSEIQLGNLKYNCCGNIQVYVKGKQELSYAEELMLKGHLFRPYKYGTKKRNYQDYLKNQGIYCCLYVKSVSGLVRLHKHAGLAVKRLAFWLKDKMQELIFKYVSNLSCSIINAMIFGERRHIPRFIENTMIKSGTVHILVVSGFNVGIVAFIIILFLKLIRLPKNLRLCIAIMCLMVYCLMTGASTPVIRATVMGIVFMFGILLKREPDIYNSCAVACLFILLVNPGQLFEAGFQLSFVSVVSIVYFYPKIKAFLHLGCVKIKYLRFLLEGCLVSFSAWLGTMGFIAYYFKIFSPVTVLANIFIVPLATLITLCGFSLILVSLIFPPLAPLFASVSELVVALLLKINIFLVKLPGAYFYLP